jgi:hypothetical protein
MNDNTDPNVLDRDKLGKVLGMLGSTHDGKALVAARLASELVRDSGLTWPDILQPFADLQSAIGTAKQLLAENEALRKAAIEPARNEGDWQNVGEPREQARWALNLHSTHQLRLNGFEEQLLEAIATGEGSLTEKQTVFFQRILTKLLAQIGRTPP